MGSIFRKPLETLDKGNKYSIYGLKRNPFPADPTVKPNSTDVRENGTIFLTDLREQEFIEFSDKFINNESKIGFLMDYAAYKGRGIGKTAFLNYEKNAINKDLGETITKGKDVLFAVYASPDPYKKDRSMAMISRTIYQAMLNSELFLIVFSRLRAFSGCISEELLDKIVDIKFEDTIANDKWLYDQGVDVEKVNLQLNKTLYSLGFHVQFPERSLFPEDQDGLFNDETNSYKTFRDSLIVENTDNYWKKNGSDYLFSKIVRLLKAALITHVVILFDEVEKIVTYQNFAERHAFCDGLRNLFIDGPSQNALDGFYKILLTIHPNSQELLMPHWKAAGLDRFSELGGSSSKDNTVFFQPIINTEEMAEKLALVYLDSERPGSKGSINPFTSEALKTAMLKADNIPGKYLKYLYAAIENGVKNKWELIDTPQISEFWSTTSLPVVSPEEQPKLPDVKISL